MTDYSPAQAQTAPNAEAMPLFYTAPRPLDRAQDGDLRVGRPLNYNFAAKANAIPLLVDEFPMASAYYPIVFVGTGTPIPAVVTGLKNDTNLFISPEGAWQAGTYLPAYVRRYPFILMDDPDKKQFVLCLDTGSDMVGRDDGFPLFDKGEPSEFTKGAMEFCVTLRQQGDTTDAFVQALQEHKLLIPNDAQINAHDGTRLQLSGFLVIDPQKFDELPDSVIVQWRRKGWLGLVYAHLLSSHRWQTLVDLMQARGA